MNIKLEDFIGELLTNWEAGFHWGLKITIDCDMRNNPDYWEFYITGNGAVLASDVHQGHFDSLVAEVVGKAYSAAIATKNGGQFGYKPGVLHFDDWVSNSMDAAKIDASIFILPDPAHLWQEYRVAMMAKYRSGNS